LGEDQPVISLQLFDPSVKTDEMPATVEEVAKGYVELIQRVQPKGPYALMGWCAAGALSFEIARQLVAANQEVSNLYLMDAWAPRYIDRQPAPRRWIADYSLRWQLIRADWRRVTTGEQTLAAFLNARNSVKGLVNLWRRIRRMPVFTTAPPDEITCCIIYSRSRHGTVPGITRAR
jgi:thioesterase domain-containing protein